MVTRYYVDASVALHAILPGGDPRARAWLDEARREGQVFSSTLLHLEMTRVLRREQLDVERVVPVLDRITQISIDDGILRIASAIEPHVKSLDAIHLATCCLLGSGPVLVTHDVSMAAAGKQLGLEPLDPVGALP